MSRMAQRRSPESSSARLAPAIPAMSLAVFALWQAAALLSEFVPGAPLTRGQVELMRRDNVVSKDLPGLRNLQIVSTALEDVIPTVAAGVGRRGADRSIFAHAAATCLRARPLQHRHRAERTNDTGETVYIGNSRWLARHHPGRFRARDRALE